MNIGSLFVELGVKGGNSAISQVGSIHKGLRDAAIIANQTVQMMYRLYSVTKQIVTENASLGKELSNTSKELDISTDRLQRWDYAARLSGAQAGEMNSAFKALQSSLLDIRDNDVPEYFQYLFSQMEQVDKSFDSSKFLSGDLDYAMSSIRNLAKNGEYDLARLNRALSSLGFSDGVSSFLRLSNVDLSKISRDLVIPDKNVKALDEMYQGIVKIEQISKVAFADIAKAFDAKLINDLGVLIKELADVVRELVQLAKDSGVFTGASNLAQGAKNDISTLRKLVNGEVSVSQVAKDTGAYYGEQFGPFLEMMKNNLQMAWSERQSPVAYITNNITTRDDPASIGDAVSENTVDGMTKAMQQIQPERGGSRAGGVR